MTQQFLDASQIGTVVQHVGGEAVSQRVRADAGSGSGGGGRSERSAGLVEEAGD